MSEWRPFEPSKDDCDRAFRNAIGAVFDEIDDAQRRRDAQRRFVSLLMRAAIARVRLFVPFAIEGARLILTEEGDVVLEYDFPLCVDQVAFTHTVIV